MNSLLDNYSLISTDKTNLFLSTVFGLCFLGFGSFMLPPLVEFVSKGGKFPYEECILLVVCYLWAIYVLVTVILMSMNKYKSIIIDNETSKFIFKTNTLKNIELPFEYVSEVKIKYGRLAPRISIACVQIIDRYGSKYSLPISEYVKFYDNLPDYITKNYEFPWFITIW